MKSETLRNKGFLFTVAAIVLLSFLLITAALWSRVVEEREATVPQKAKLQAFQQILGQLSEDKVSNFSKISAYYAFYRLDNHTSHEAISGSAISVPALRKEDFEVSEYPADTPDNPGTGAINDTIHDLMFNGSSDGNGSWPASTYPNPRWRINYTDDERYRYTFLGWRQQMQDAAGQMDFNLTIGDTLENFSVYQVDPWTANVSFNVTFSLRDNDGFYEMNKTLAVSFNFSLEGFNDPLSARMSAEWMSPGCVPPLSAERQMFPHPWSEDPLDFAPTELLDTGTKGRGFAYGEVVFNCNPLQDGANRKISMVDGASCPNMSLNGSLFAGLIVKQPPVCPNADCPDMDIREGPQRFGSTSSGGCTYSCFVREYYVRKYENTTNCIDCLEWYEHVNYTRSALAVDPTSCSLPAETDPIWESACPDSDAHAALPSSVLDRWDETDAKVYANSVSVPYLELDSTAFNDLKTAVISSDVSDYAAASSASLNATPRYIGLLFNNEADLDADVNASLGVIRNGFHEIWYIDAIRDLAICGYYVQYDNAPSVFQRQVEKGYDITYLGGPSEGLGVESLLVGSWAGGKCDAQRATHDGFSHVDYLFLRDPMAISGTVVKGMPGCRTWENCANESVIEDGVGRFAIDTAGADNHASLYGLTDLLCTRGARCD